MSPFEDANGNLPGWRGDASAQDGPHVWTVSEVTRMVREAIAALPGPLWARGELSNLTIHRSGHVYFSIKDARSQLSTVFFRGAAEARSMGLREGMEVEVCGQLSVYEPRGQYQLIVDRVRACGEGDLQRRLEATKRKLRAEGLFDPDRKRPLPVLPRIVGVVTSPQGAALQDFLQVLDRRFASLHVRVAPVPVQGEGAAAQVAGAVRYLNRTRACDVIVVTRGGGSLEDLWAFNDEPLARTVAESAIPVVSAVGHEVDVTVCDLVADLRAPTPSAAAELVIRTKNELAERIETARQRLGAQVRLKMQSLENRVHRAARNPVFREPAHVVGVHQQRVDALLGRAATAITWRIRQDHSRIERQKASLQALSPKRVLERGYALLTPSEGGDSVTDAAQVKRGDALRAVLARGELNVQVTQTSEESS